MDPWIVLMLGLLFKSENIDMEELPMDELKAKIQESIEKKLENPDISASDIKILAEAYANDKAAEFWYFYSGLLNNGFTEEQAMQILLAVSKK